MATGIQEKTFQSGLPDLLKGLFGEQSTTNSNTTSTANTGPLEAAIGQSSKQMTTEQLQALVASIFSSAAQQVPTLTGALANATGTRSSNNSPLALAINEQNNLAGKQLTQSLLDYNQRQSQIAVQGAGALANATRSEAKTTTTATGAAAGDNSQLKTLLFGFLANQADKRGLLDKVGKGIFGGATDSVAASTPGFMSPQSQDFQSPFSQDTTFGPTPTTNFAAVPDLFQNSTLDLSGSSLFGDVASGSGVDLGLDYASNAASSGVDLGLDYATDSAPVDEILNLFADGGSPQPAFKQIARPSIAPAINQVVFGYADGGAVDIEQFTDGWDDGENPVHNQLRVQPQMFQPQQIGSVPGFADGGTVIRNRNNLGTSPARQGTLALQGTQAQTPQTPQTPQAPKLPALELPGLKRQPPGLSDSNSPAPTMSPAQEALVADNISTGKNANIGKAAASFALNAMVPALAIPGVKGLLTNQLLAFMEAQNSQAASGLPVEGTIAVQGPTGAMSSQAASQSIFGNTTNTNQSMVSLPTAIDGFTASAPASSGVTGDGSTPGPGGESVYADGGLVTGPGTGTSDSIGRKSKVPGSSPYAVSADEYIIPKDVVDSVGKKFFDDLLSAIHRPVRR
jgi:hypothetical protein